MKLACKLAGCLKAPFSFVRGGIILAFRLHAESHKLSAAVCCAVVQSRGHLEGQDADICSCALDSTLPAAWRSCLRRSYRHMLGSFCHEMMLHVPKEGLQGLAGLLTGQLCTLLHFYMQPTECQSSLLMVAQQCMQRACSGAPRAGMHAVADVHAAFQCQPSVMAIAW